MAITANWNQPNPILSTTSSTVYTPSDVPVENTDKHVVVLIPVALYSLFNVIASYVP